jgi:hypothetical protein
MFQSNNIFAFIKPYYARRIHVMMITARNPAIALRIANFVASFGWTIFLRTGTIDIRRGMQAIRLIAQRLIGVFNQVVYERTRKKITAAR